MAQTTVLWNATLIAVAGSPADDVSVLESKDNVQLVFKEGSVMKRVGR
jgi:hypothetical protein